MRIAVVSDIHGNRTAFDAVLADLRLAAPDLILHGGDLVHGGASPAYIADRIRDLGWQGVLGNTDEMLFRPESLREFARGLPNLQAIFAMIEEMAMWDRGQLGADRLADPIPWVSQLPLHYLHDTFALVHASPESCWRAPGADASDPELESTFSKLNRPLVVYGHIHRPFIRKISITPSSDQMPWEKESRKEGSQNKQVRENGVNKEEVQKKEVQKKDLREIIIANSGSVSLSHDGDPRASYLLIENGVPQIRRVEYDLQQEIRSLQQSSMPHAQWIIRTLQAASPQMP